MYAAMYMYMYLWLSVCQYNIIYVAYTFVLCCNKRAIAWRIKIKQALAASIKWRTLLLLLAERAKTPCKLKNIYTYI